MSDQSASELIQLGIKSFNRGDYQRALGWFEQAVTRARRDGQTGWELEALGWLAVAWGNLGEYEKNAEAATRLLARARQVENETYEMKAALRLCGALADIDLRARWHEIRPLMIEGLAIARRLGNNYYEVYHLMRLGGYAVWMDEQEQGYAWLQEALSAIGPGTEQAAFFRCGIYADLSLLMRERKDYAEAVRYAEMAVGQAEQGGNPQFVAYARLTLARAERARGELGAALVIVEEVLPAARERGWQGEEQDAEYLRGEMERVLGHPKVAVAAARRALALAQAMKLKEEEVECMLSLGQALHALGERAEAREVLQHARHLCQERDYEDNFNEVEELLALWTT
jgi:tetratricopeptide (TPR) repeat protein